MKSQRTLAGMILVSAITGACIHTQELPLAPNVVRLDTQASGKLFVGQAASSTMKRAAQITLDRGYTHFRFAEAEMRQGEQYAGSITSGQATTQGTATRNSPTSAIYSGNTTMTTASTSVYRPTANVAVTVVMFKATDPEADGAFDAREVLKKE